MNNVGVYIHIPFCHSICSYCDFCKVIYNQKWAVEYLKSLKKEIDERYMGEKVKTIYIGGGTPSCLSLKEIEFVLTLTKLFDVSLLEEFTFECNIEDIKEDLLLLLKRFNVNRLSIGIESFDEDNIKFLKRKYFSYEEIKSKIDLAKSIGFNNINVDLMYALPIEKIKVLKKDIKSLLDLDVEHISTYSLMIEDNTYLSYKKVNSISQDIDAEMYEIICNSLIKDGYNHYEVSNFAKIGYESKHNLTYWNNLEYYGFGAGASGYIAGFRYDNTRSLSDYIDGKFSINNNILSKQDIMDYEVILGLRKLEGINIKEFYDKYNVSFQNTYPLNPLINNGDLIFENGYVKINPNKIYVMNEILIKLV